MARDGARWRAGEGEAAGGASGPGGGRETRPFLARAADRAKDQSYMLAMVPPAILARLEFPLGDMTKTEVREAARAAGLAAALGVSRQTVNELLRERRSVSPEMALRLSRLFGNSPEFWLNAQRTVDLWDAAQSVGREVKRIKPLTLA